MIRELQKTAPASRYYFGYSDHMWRYYVAFRNGQPAAASDISRLNWSVCDRVYNTLSAEHRDLIRLFYLPDRDRDATLRQFCIDRHLSDTAAWRIINRCRRLVAEHRGLVERWSEEGATENKGS